ncbi:MAG: heme ABC exporter ATP-binding protein CcmA [Acetobacteraceae bacterium]
MLQAKAVAAFRGERLIFRDLEFSVPAGGALVVTGPNGAGKSTLLRLLAGLVRPAAGTVLWDGEDALADLPLHARRVAYVGHLDAIKPGLSVAENLLFAPGGGCRAVSEGLAAMRLTGLAELPARMLSAGQKRRLALARLALTDAPLWLLDEPTSGLDAGAIGRLGDLLGDHLRGGGIVVAATHLPLPLPQAVELRLG